MMEVDHRQFFTQTSLRALLDGVFGSSDVQQASPLDRHIARLVLPRALRPLYRFLDRRGRAPYGRYYFRLLGRAGAVTASSSCPPSPSAR